MIFAGPCSPRFTADTLVVSLNVGEGGPGEALRFPCAFVAIVKGRRGRGLGIAERGYGLGAAESEGEGEGFDVTVVQSEPLQFASGGLKCSCTPRYAQLRIWTSIANTLMPTHRQRVQLVTPTKLSSL